MKLLFVFSLLFALVAFCVTVNRVTAQVLPTPPFNVAYTGCFADQASPRVLSNNPNPNTQAYTFATCMQLALVNGAQYFGLEFGGQCYWGNSFTNQVASTSCNMACTTDGTQLCGGYYALQFYTINFSQTVNATYVGCFVDQASPRALPLGDPSSQGYLAPTCQQLALANNAKYFGLEFGGQCFYGNSFLNLGSSTSCTTACTSRTSKYCGGYYAIDVWQQTPQ